MKAHEFVEQLRHDDIVSAIREAEAKTSAEIRVFISHKPVVEPIAAAQAHFLRMGMQQTKDRNGVLIFVAPRSQNFAVVGDLGVHKRCGDFFWQELASEMTQHFKGHHFSRGLLHGIKKAGELLASHFPRESDDQNELSDRVESD